MVGWTDGFDPHGEEGYVPVLAEPLPVDGARRRPPAEDRYLHVILDEAQDLSPMECRMIARRAEYASMTIVGDLGQATHPLAAGSWPRTAHPARQARGPDAGAAHRIPGAPGHRGLRGAGPRPRDRADALVPARRHAVGAAGRRPARRGPGSSPAGTARRDGRRHRRRRRGRGLVPLIDLPDVAVVPASLVKGLEYDHVIVVEPADIVAAEPRGLNRLYVALTRAVAGLVILHQKSCPPPCASRHPTRPLRRAAPDGRMVAERAVRQRHGRLGKWPPLSGGAVDECGTDGPGLGSGRTSYIVAATTGSCSSRARGAIEQCGSHLPAW